MDLPWISCLLQSLTLFFFFPPNAGAGCNSPYLSESTCRPHGMVNGQKSLDLCSHSPDCRQPSPLTSPLLNDAGSVRTDDEDEVRRKVCNHFIFISLLCFTASFEYLKYSFFLMFNLSRFCVLIFLVLLIFQRFPTDRAYFIAKELLTTERTYVKDLEVVTVVREDGIGSLVCLFGLDLYSVEKNIDYSAFLLHCRKPAKTQAQGRFGRWDYFICDSFSHLD